MYDSMIASEALEMYNSGAVKYYERSGNELLNLST